MIVDKNAVWIDTGAVLYVSPTGGIDPIWTENGSSILDGINEELNEVAMSANGGLVFGGSAIVSMSGGIIARDEVANGGIVFGGSALHSNGTYNLKEVVASGGFVLGGSSLYSFTQAEGIARQPSMFVVM